MPRSHRAPAPYWVHSDPDAPAATGLAQTVCPGWHNDPWRAADPDDRGEPAYGDPVWCENCTTRLRSTIAYLPHLARALETELAEATDAAGEHVSGTRERAIHEHQAHAFLLDDIRDVLTQLEDEVRTQRALSDRDRRMRQIPAIEAAATFLGAHLEWILTCSEEAGEPDGLVRAFADRIHRLDRRGMHLTHQDEPRGEPCVGVPCRSCSWKALVKVVDRTGADQGEVKCENCGAKTTLADYQAWAAQWAVHDYAYLSDERRAELGATVTAFERARGIAA